MNNIEKIENLCMENNNDKFLFNYCRINKFVQNFETQAILFNY